MVRYRYTRFEGIDRKIRWIHNSQSPNVGTAGAAVPTNSDSATNHKAKNQHNQTNAFQSWNKQEGDPDAPQSRNKASTFRIAHIRSFHSNTFFNMCRSDPKPEDTEVSNDNGNPEKDGNDASIAGSDKDEHDASASLLKLLGLARPEAGMLSFALMLMIAAEASGLVTPLLVAQAYDDLIDVSLSNSERMSNISWSMGLVLMIHFGGVVLAFLRTCIMGVAGERVVARVRTQLYGSILKQEIGFFDTHKSGELVSRLGSDTALLQQGTSSAIPEVVLGFLKTLIAVAIMFWISPKLAGVMIGFVFVILMICVVFGGLLSKLAKKYQDVLGEAQTYSTEALGAMRTVQSSCAEGREERRYAIAVGEPTKFWWPIGHKQHPTTYSVGFYKAITTSAFFTVLFGMGFGGLYISLWYGFKLVLDGEITLGALTAFQSYVFIIGGGLGQTSQFVTKVLEASGAAARIFYLLERTPIIPTPIQSKHSDVEEPKKPSSMEGAVAFNSVNFSYPSRPGVQVLRDFSLSIPANQTAALVGSSGAGKYVMRNAWILTHQSWIGQLWWPSFKGSTMSQLVPSPSMAMTFEI